MRNSGFPEFHMPYFIAGHAEMKKREKRMPEVKSRACENEEKRKMHAGSEESGMRK